MPLSRKTFERVFGDVYDAQNVTSSTPTFIILFGGEGKATHGAKSSDEFLQTLRTLLEVRERRGSPNTVMVISSPNYKFHTDHLSPCDPSESDQATLARDPWIIL